MQILADFPHFCRFWTVFHTQIHTRRSHLGCEEFHSGDLTPMSLLESFPGRGTVGCWFDPIVLQHPGDRAGRYPMPKLFEFALDPAQYPQLEFSCAIRTIRAAIAFLSPWVGLLA